MKVALHDELAKSSRVKQILVLPHRRMNTQATQSALRFRVTDDGVNEKSIPSHSSTKIKDSHDEADIIDPQDNWIARLLYGSRVGLTINFAFLAISSLAFIISLPHKIKVYDPRFDLLVRTLFQFFRYTLPFDCFVNLFILCVFYPLTRVTRSPRRIWMITVICSISLYAMLTVYFDGMLIFLKLLMLVDCTRLSMKLISYSSECLTSERVHSQSSGKSLMYFLYAPTLIYRAKYPRTRSIRWVKMLGNLWWCLVSGIVLGEYYYSHLASVFTFDLASGTLSTRLTSVLSLYLNITIGYLFVIWFSFFENFCGFHGELLRFPYLKLFGELSDCVQGEKLASQVNITVSAWLSRYVYKPVRVRTKSRAKALTAAIAFSLFLHEVCGSLAFRTFLPLPYLIWIVIGPITLYLQMNNRLIKYSIAFIFAHMIPLYLFGHPLEYIAWNYSSCDTKSFSSFSLAPLYASCIMHNL